MFQHDSVAVYKANYRMVVKVSVEESEWSAQSPDLTALTICLAVLPNISD